MDSNHKRIAKNSLFLYLQMAIRMIVSLYTTRVVLHALGADDFGINNVVAGFVAMFGFISNTMSASAQRFFACELGLGNRRKLNQYFNMTLLCYVIISVLLIVIIEIVGLWFVNYKMVIPSGRTSAANWVFQFAVIAVVFRMLVVPYWAMILAYEKMIAFAIVGLSDSCIILVGAFLLNNYSGDRLIAYSALLSVVALFHFLFYLFFGKKTTRGAVRIHFFWNKSMFVELISYSGWSLFWTLANVVRSQGINVLLNVFFGARLNAARGIAYQVNSAVQQFVDSFYQAVRPQIMKQTAKKENNKMMNLTFTTSRISFYMMILVVIPILVKTPYILFLWLKDFPEYTVEFTRLVVVIAMIDSLGLPLTTSVCATGKIKWFHICIGGILILNLPISYILLRQGWEPQIVFVISIVASILAQTVRVIFMKNIFKMSLKDYLCSVILKMIFVFSLSFVFSYLLGRAFDNSFLNLCLYVIVSVLVTCLFSYLVGITKREKEVLNKVLKARFVQFTK